MALQCAALAAHLRMQLGVDAQVPLEEALMKEPRQLLPVVLFFDLEEHQKTHHAPRPSHSSAQFSSDARKVCEDHMSAHD